MLQHRSSRIALGVVLTLVMAACSKGNPTSGGSPSGGGVAAYVSGVCGAVSDWENAVQSLATGFPAQIQGASSLDAAKQLFVQYVDENVTATDTMIAKIQALGTPSVANGAEIQSKVVGALQQVDASFAEAKSKAEQLDTTNPTTFSSGVTDISNTLDSELSGLGDPLAGVSSSELETAASADPACQKLNPSP